MPQYQIVPVEKPDTAVEVDARDPGSALHVASQLGCSDADIRQDGRYLFSVRTLGGKSSFWQIFQRAEPLHERVPVE